MKKRLIFSFFVFLICYSLSIFIWGQSGLLALHELRTVKTEVEKNIKDIKEINTILNIRLSSLQTDPDTIKLQARRIGLLEKNESLLYVNGWNLNTSSYYPGVPLKDYTPRSFNRDILFLLSLFVALSIFLLSLFFYAYKDYPRIASPPFSS